MCALKAATLPTSPSLLVVLCPVGAAAAPQLQQLRRFAVVSGDDSHDDFKPHYKQEPVPEPDVDDQIKKDISSHQVFIYMKVQPHQRSLGS